ncbi:MAG: hemin uptake protein HemP [Variovorax sp.]|nr:hemin uptake protein HemP [Variovorax sp.]
MPATSKAISAARSVLPHPVEGGAPAQAQSDPAPPLESAALFRGRRTVVILHNGSLYRLQTTKLGKLILTK